MLITILKFQPPFSVWRFCGMVFVGYLWGSVIHSAIPRDGFAGYNVQFLYALVPLGCALGEYSFFNNITASK